MSTIVVSKSSFIVLGIGAAIGIIIGVIIGHFSATGEPEDLGYAAYRTDQWVQDGGEGDPSSGGGRSPDDLVQMVSAERIGENIRELTKAPHLAGTERDTELARLIQRRFQDLGFNSVEMPQRSFLLSRPDPQKPNLIRIRDGNNGSVFTTNYKEQALHPDDEHNEFVHAFNAYTPKGDVWSASGEGVVYVNYGRIEDYEQIEKMGISVKGRIAIMRYGKIFRGNKVEHATRFGAVGAILYSDPEDVAREGQRPEDVYPFTKYLPGTGMQRGTTFLGDGDPLTPGWPSTDHAHRIKKEDAGLASIPCQPIGYGDAKEFLSKLAGPKAPEEWQGKIEGIEYHIGPQFKPEFAGYRIQLTSNNKEMVVQSYNVIGTIAGSVETDRYVLIGNHRDAWGYGASDPSSGTAQLLETARVLGDLLKTGWRPRRTIVFCSWGSEEYGLIGSTEWVEEHVDKLQGRAVAYVNTDTCASGSYVQLKASPLLWDLLTKIASKVPGVLNPSGTLLEEWIANDKLIDPEATQHPILGTLGSGSDYAAFLFYAGIPSMDVWFRDNQHEHKGTYPSYHTGYETYYMISNITDPGSKVMQGCSRVATLTLKYLSDSLIIPFSLSHFPKAMMKSLKGFEKDGKKEKLSKIYSKYAFLEKAVDDLLEATETFHREIEENKKNPLAVRAINDQLMKFEQTFLLPAGLPGRTMTRHAIFAPSKFDNYASAGFPGLSDLLYGYDKLTEGDRKDRDEQIRRHISDLTILTDRARGIINTHHKFD